MANVAAIGSTRKSHRERKNGSSREVWQKRKAASNAARGRQFYIVDQMVNETAVGHWMRA